MRWLRRRRRRRLLLIGLDSASPELVFRQFNAHLPHLRQLMAAGQWGVLQSSVPCITVPAWSSMMTSLDAGTLGIYGFRNRASWGYDALSSADSRAVTAPRVWDVLGQAGKVSVVASVPQTYPVSPVNGWLIADFLTPNHDTTFTYPALLRAEILQRCPDYPFDAAGYRTADKPALVHRLMELSNQQYLIFEHLLRTREWDFAMHVNMATDRLHHAFWRYHDPQHRLHEPSPVFGTMVRDYYQFVDAWVGRLLGGFEEPPVVMVVSDHGVKRMDGAVALNQWLYDNGWLALRQPLSPGEVTPFRPDMVDWPRTRAWSAGGYYGRVFLNIRGREPQGCVDPAEADAVADALADALRAIPDERGLPMNTRVMRPRDVYQQVNGFPPDLIVYFGDLHWRVVGGLGYAGWHTLENDTGPDDANHAEEGLFILADPESAARGECEPRPLLDIAPTILQRMGVPVPSHMQGRAF